MSGKEYLLVGYAVLLLVGRSFSQRQRKTFSTSNEVSRFFTDHTAIIMAAVSVIAFTSPLAEAILKENTVINWLSTIVGIVIILLGWLLAYYANKTIAENWSATIDKTQEQELITQGVYSLVRHPLYLSGILILVGTNVYFRNTWSWFAILLAFIIVLYRIPREENLLIERFGEEYREFKKNTKSIIPWLY